MGSTIFIRERRKVEKGEKKPRFRVVGVQSGDLKIYASHLRKKELDQICAATGAKLVTLDAGEGNRDGGGQ
jgi:hypothetical protein